MRALAIPVFAWLAACGSDKAASPEPHAVVNAASAGSGSASTGSPSTGSASTGMITDEQCIARGGQIVTEQTYRHLRRDPEAPVTPFKVCRFPSPKNDAACRGDSDCAGGHCFCTGSLARPDPMRDPKLQALDGTAATGRCSDQPLPSGSWFCLVSNGKVMLHGIIVD